MIRRILPWSAAVLATLLVTMLLLLTWGVGTTHGTRTLWRVVSDALPGLQAGSVSGRLAGPLTVRDLRYEDAYRQLAIGAVEFDWSPRSLLLGEAHIERLRVAEIEFTQIKPAPPPEEESAFELPDSFKLPLDVLLDDITLQGLSFRSSPEAQPLQVDRARLAASFRQHDLSLDSLEASGPLFRLQGVARAVTRGNYPAEATVDWEVRPAQLAPAAGRLEIEGGLQEMRIGHTLEPPYRIEQTLMLRDIAGKLRFDLDTLVSGLQLSEVGDSMPDAVLDGRLSAEGTLRKIAFQGQVTTDSEEFGRFSLGVSGGFQEQVLALSELLLAGTGNMRLQAEGAVDLGEDSPQIELRGRWQALRWPLTGAPQLLATDGHGSVLGVPGDYAVQASSSLEVPGQTGGELEIIGRGSKQAFELSRLQLSLLDGRMDGVGRVRWAPALEGSIEFSGEGLAPSVLLPELSADLRLDLRAQGQLTGGLFTLDKLELAAGATRIAARGQLGEDMDLDWLVNSPDVGEILPEATGQIAGRGRISGTAPLPALRATLDARDLSLGQYSLAALSLRADVDLNRAKPSDLALSLRDAALGGITVDSLDLSGEGVRSSHTLGLSVDSSAGAVDLEIEGDLQDVAWAMQVSRGRLQYGELPPWTLSSPHRGQITREQQQLREGCWNSDQARLCFQGELAPDKVAAELDLKGLALDYLEPLLPASLAMRGRLAAHATLARQGAGEPSVNALLSAEGVELRSSEATVQPNRQLLALGSSRVALDYSQSGLSANLSLPFAGEGGISGYAQVEPGNAVLNERPLRGRLDIDLRDLSFLTALSPEIERAAGALRGHVELSGSLSQILPEGELSLVDTGLQLVTPGLDITGIRLRAYTTGPAAVAFEGRARSGEGELVLSGSSQFDGPQALVNARVRGDTFQVVDTPEARVFVSPDLAIAVSETGVRVSGNVVVPRAAITPRKLPESAVSASGDQVIISGDRDGEYATANSGVEADLRITLGDDVTVDGFGFNGRLEGGLSVKQVPGKPGTGTGEFNIIDGEYRAYGQGLVIEQGKILFAGGPLDQPGISVRAVRRPATGILVGIRARGPVRQPELEVFSEPGMSQTEQLSWLVLGRSLANTSDGEGDMLVRAATMLGLKGGNFLADKFGADLGVDTIGFEAGSGEAGAASDVNQAAFVIGKYLTPDLYVSYGTGLFESVSTIRLEYSLDENWKLSTESSTLSSGGDVIYTIER